MTIYQEEMQRKAQHYGCITSYDEADQLLLISHKGVHLTAINPEGFMFYNSKDITDPESREVFSHLTDDAETVREYAVLYFASQKRLAEPQLCRRLRCIRPSDVADTCRSSADRYGVPLPRQRHGWTESRRPHCE